eukprot:scaffold789_cov26-Tisochrysis_lutea.AAC.3
MGAVPTTMGHMLALRTSADRQAWQHPRYDTCLAVAEQRRGAWLVMVTVRQRSDIPPMRMHAVQRGNAICDIGVRPEWGAQVHFCQWQASMWGHRTNRPRHRTDRPRCHRPQQPLRL